MQRGTISVIKHSILLDPSWFQVQASCWPLMLDPRAASHMIQFQICGTENVKEEAEANFESFGELMQQTETKASLQDECRVLCGVKETMVDLRS